MFKSIARKRGIGVKDSEESLVLTSSGKELEIEFG